jgi:ribosomal protein S27E
MSPKIKRAKMLFFETRVVMECPFCGMTLLKTSYHKVGKLLDDERMPRGKVCAKCGGVVVLKLNSKGREKVLSKISEGN